MWESGILSLLISKLELMLPIPLLFAASSGSPVASLLGRRVWQRGSCKISVLKETI